MNDQNYLPIGTWPLDWHSLVNFKPGTRNGSSEMQDCSPLSSIRNYFASRHLPIYSDFFHYNRAYNWMLIMSVADIEKLFAC